MIFFSKTKSPEYMETICLMEDEERVIVSRVDGLRASKSGDPSSLTSERSCMEFACPLTESLKYCISTNREGFGQTVRMRRLI